MKILTDKPENVVLERASLGGLFLILEGRLRALQGVLFGDTQILLSPDDVIWLYQGIHKLAIQQRVATQWEPNVAAALAVLDEAHLTMSDENQDAVALVQDAIDYLERRKAADSMSKEWKPEDEKDPQEELLRKLSGLLPDPDDPMSVARGPVFMQLNDPREEARQLYWARKDRCFRILLEIVHAVSSNPSLVHGVVEGKLDSQGMAHQAVYLERALDANFERMWGPLPGEKP